LRNLSPWRHYVIKNMVKFSCRLGLKLAGYTSLETSETFVDYSPYLGPEWVANYSGASTLISNHTSWMDSLTAIILYFPTFVARSTGKTMPIIGNIMDAMSTIWIEQ
jgi:1-acyl-sn-glycerol-3-phosphate acyltransferase